MRKILINIIFLLISSIKSQFNEALCPNYKCLEDSSNICQKMEKIDDLVTYSVKQCPEGQYCKIDPSTSIGTCSTIEQRLPGIYCTENSQCKSGICEDKKCKGASYSNECKVDGDCDPGLYCEDGKCKYLLSEGQQCNTDFECNSNSGCFNGKCTKYLSLKVGEETNNKFLCESFNAYFDSEQFKLFCVNIQKKESEMKCSLVTNTCDYTVSYGEKTVDFRSLCQCTYSLSSLKVCPFEANQDIYKEAAKALKTHLTDYAPKMNTAMKLTPLNKDIALAIYKTTQGNTIYETSDCVLDAILSINLRLPPPPVQKCEVMYKCNDDPSSDVCYSTSMTEKEELVYTVKKCPEWKTCQTDPQTNKNICLDDQSKLLPGLMCLDNKQCLSGECTNSTCIGKKEGDQCSTDKDCHVGLFCNVDKCSPVVEVGGDCERDDQCVNNAFCHNNKCTEYLSLEDGEEAKEELHCKSMFIARNKDGVNVCASRTKLSPETECAADQSTCSYSYSYGGETKTKIELECKCTVASTDVRVCPIGTDSDEYKEAKEVMKKHYQDSSKKLHTTIKGPIDRDNYVKLMKALAYPELYHLSDCVIDGLLFNSRNWKLPIPTPTPGSGFNNSINKILLVLVLFIVL